MLKAVAGGGSSTGGPTPSGQVNIVANGAKPGRAITDAVTNSTNQVMSATANFTAADIGAVFTLCDQAAYTNLLNGTIAAVTNATTATMSVTAGFSVTGAGMALGPDSTAAIDASVALLSSPLAPILFVPIGIYLTRHAIIIPNGCSIYGEAIDYGLSTCPIAAGSALLLCAAQGGTAFVALGTGASFAGGQTRATIQNCGIDACNNSVNAVQVSGTRSVIQNAQIWRGNANTIVAFGQNFELYDSYVGAHNIGNVINNQSSDSKICRNQIRQGGAAAMSITTGHQIYVLPSGQFDCQIIGNHIFSGFNGLISSTAQGSNIFIRGTGSTAITGLIQISGNALDGCYGPQIVIRNDSTSRLSQINIGPNEIFQTPGFPDNTFPVVSIQPTGTGAIRGVSINSNNGTGNANNFSALVIVEAGASGSITGTYTHTSVNGNVFQNCDALFSNYTPDSQNGNVISENFTTTVTLGDNGGVSTQNGTGAQTAFNIPHGLAATPSRFVVTAGSAVASAAYSVTATSTNIVVTFAVAPILGTGNVVLNWMAKV